MIKWNKNTHETTIKKKLILNTYQLKKMTKHQTKSKIQYTINYEMEMIMKHNQLKYNNI